MQRYNFPPVVMNLLVINCLVFMAQSLLPREMQNFITYNFALFYPESPLFRFWQPLTYMFLHGGTLHLFSNMFALWMFGRQLEYDLGSKRFLIYYLVAGVGAALLQLGVSWIEISHLKASAVASGVDPYSVKEIIGRLVRPTVGASGGVFGILLAFGVMHPNAMIMLLIPPIPMKAKYFVILYGIFELVAGLGGIQADVAHFAHVGGMLWGYMLLRIWKARGKIYY